MNFTNTLSYKNYSRTGNLSTRLKESVIKQLEDRLEFVWSELIKYVTAPNLSQLYEISFPLIILKRFVG